MERRARLSKITLAAQVVVLDVDGDSIEVVDELTLETTVPAREWPDAFQKQLDDKLHELEAAAS